MDLSGVIFVALAIGWAVYLIPKALKHQDDLALSRSVDSFSDSVRVVGRRPSTHSAVEQGAQRASTPVVEQRAQRAVSRDQLPTRAAARRAAQRRRRVLAVLLVGLLATVGTSWFAVTPWWSTAIPGGLIVVFLVVARRAVRTQRARAAVAVAPVVAAPVVPLTEAEMQPDLGREDTTGLSRDELAAAVSAPTTDAGGLWDPLPVTLPTYVNKARARRTVRTIELTQTGVTSSGHDEADTALAREAAAMEKEAEAPAAEEAPQRKVAGA